MENNSQPSYMQYRLPILLGEFLELRLRMITHSSTQQNAQILSISEETSTDNVTPTLEPFTNDSRSKATLPSMRLLYDRETLLLKFTSGEQIQTIQSHLPANITEQMVLLGRFRNTFWLLVIPAEESSNFTTQESPQNIQNNQNLHPQIGRLPGRYDFTLGPNLIIGSSTRVSAFHGCVYDIDVRASPSDTFMRLNDSNVQTALNVEQCDFDCT